MKLSKVGRSASLDRTCLKLNLTNVPGRSSREPVINGKKYLQIESTDDTVLSLDYDSNSISFCSRTTFIPTCAIFQHFKVNIHKSLGVGNFINVDSFKRIPYNF